MNRFAICMAFALLEQHYNVGGILRERPSNQRRRESIGCQLARIGYSNPFAWVDITAEPELDAYGYPDPFDDAVREVYLRHVLLWKLPMDDGLKAAARRVFTPEYLAQFEELL